MTNDERKRQDSSGIAEETGEEVEYDIYSLSDKAWASIQKSEEQIKKGQIYPIEEIFAKIGW